VFSQARRPELHLEAEPLRDLLEEVGDNVLELAETIGPTAPWRWTNEVGEDVVIRGDRQLLLRVFENIARNAFEAGATEVRLTARDGGERWAIGIADNGPGLPPQARENLFQPFRGSVRAGGTGLGLAIAWELVQAHGGRLRLAATGTTGTRFIAELPKAAWRNDRRRQSA
jgi:signal transduction histidine kinase